VDSGSGPALVNRVSIVTIEFDDGTVGWLGLESYAALMEGSALFASNSTPDEIALVFQVPFTAAALGLYAEVNTVAAADDFELILYSDPLGTPVAERTLAFDMSLHAATNAVRVDRNFTSAYTLSANTNYAVAVRPTTTNTIGLGQSNFNTGNGNLRKATMLGTSWSKYTRTDNTGAFGSQDTTILPSLGVYVGQLDDGAGGAGGGLLRPVGLGGGLV
jgi:hypothetical protein